MRRPQVNREAINPSRGKGTLPHFGHKSFAEVLQGDSTKGGVKASLTVKAIEDGHDWLFASVIIRFNSEFSVISIRSALKDIGLNQVVVRKGGGRDAILTFKSKEELHSSMQKIKDWFKEWSLFVLEWRPGIQIDQERCVWLKCHGIPLNLWNRSNLNNIGALWGTVLQLEGDLSKPKSFTYSRIKVATTSLELINKTILLECKGILYSVFVCEDHCVDPAECNGVRNIGLADCISSSKVKFSRAEENDPIVGGCKGKDGVGLVANQFVLDDAVMPSSIEVVQRKELSHCNSREVVDTAVEETRCDVEVSRPIALGGKEAMMEECAPCPKRVDRSLMCVEHAAETGVFKNLSGSVDGFGPGINLEVVLGSPNIEQSVQGPIRKPCLQQGNRGVSLLDQGSVHGPAPFLNPIRSAKKAGKKKVQLEGFSRFARLYGHQSAAIGRLPSKSVIFRPAAVALAHSELSESESSMRSYLLKEAQATVKLGKELGIDFGGQEESVVDKILEMERKDKESYLKDGTA